MCKLQLNRLGKKLSRAGIPVLGALLLFGAGTSASWAAPVNDNLAQAITIRGITGTIAGSNAGATSQPGEPVDANTGGGKTIWYKWTATFTGTMDFNTEGSAFDTVIAVYTDPGVLSVTNLLLAAQNDDVAFPNDLTSQVEFPVTAGTTYFIQVDGHEGDSGNVILNWTSTGSFSGGNLGFAAPNTDDSGAPLYITEQIDSDPTVFTDMEFYGLQARVIRTQGNAGKISVNYVVTNTSFINTLITNFYGTNLFITNANGTFTNILSTNFVSFNFIGTYLNGLITQFAVTNAFLFGQTNADGQLSQPSITQLGTNFTLPFPCVSTNLTGTVTNTDGSLTTITTNIFCFSTVTNVVVPSAVPGTDYIPSSGTVTMVDYQMAAVIPYTVLPNFFTLDPAPATSQLVNHLLVISLSNPALDPAESTNSLAQPIIGTSNAFVQILNDDVIAGPATVTVPYSQVAGTPQNSIINWEQSVYHSFEQEPNSNQRVARLLLMRTGTNFSSGCSIDYEADFNGITNEYDTFPLEPGSDYATPTNSVPGSRQIRHYQPVGGTISWGVGDSSLKEVDVTIDYDPSVQFNEDIIMQLHNPQNCFIGQMGACTLTILFNDQPAGAVDRDHNANNVAYTNPPLNSSPGAGGSNNTVYAAIVQPADNKTVFAGDFTAYNNTTRNRIGRMNADGSLDTTFLAAPNGGANNTVSCLGLQSDGKIVIGGAFTAFNATNRFHIARLNTDGSLDLGFNTGIGANNSIWALEVYPTNDPDNGGKILIGGDFTMVDSTNRNYIARLNTNGTLDATFNPGVGPNDTVNAIALQSDGKIVLGGQFTSIDGTNFSSIARLNADGSLDTNFNPGLGADQGVFALAEQPDGTVLVGGAFATINLTSLNGIARLNTDGSIDTTFNPGTGADGTVFAITLQPDGNILIGGLFDSINGTRRVGVARLLANGPVDTSFMDTAYNQFAGLVNTINNQVVQPRNYLFTIALQMDGNVIIGGRFSQLGGGVDYNNFPTINYTTSQTNGLFTRDALSPRLNIARLIGGSTPGPGNIGLNYPSYSVDKANETYYVTLDRSNGALGPASATLQSNPLHNGVGDAVPNQDFVQAVDHPTWTTSWDITINAVGIDSTWDFSDDFSGLNSTPVNVLGVSGGFVLDSFLTILDNPKSSGNLGLNLQLIQPLGTLTLGSEPIPTGVALGTSEAPLTIVDNSIPAGTFAFSVANFFVNENATNAVITVVRTNGNVGPVTLQYLTLPGTAIVPPISSNSVALPGATNDYVSVTGTLHFNSGDLSKTFSVPIVNNNIVRPDRSLLLSLTNITGGGVIGANSNAVLTIINDNFVNGMLSFSNAVYSAQQNAGSATITVIRLGGSQGVESVVYQTSDGTATNGQDYIGTNGVLTWNSGDTTAKTFNIKLLNNGNVNNNLTVNLTLTNATVNGQANTNILQPPISAVLTIINNNFYGSPTLSAPSYIVDENAGVAVITVNRLGGSSQTITVDYATSDGTAIGGVDYTPTGGTLTFTNGQFSESFTVPITDNTVQTNDNTFFNVTLSNPQPTSGPDAPVTLGNVATAPVTIIANQVQVEPPGSPDTTFSASAAFNNTVFALALQPDGSIVAGGDFTQANGIARSRIARLNSDGELDVKFSSGEGGANDSVRALTIQSDGHILMGGLFTTVNTANQGYLARLNFDGSLDSTFNVAGQGADNPVYAVAETFNPGTSDSADRKILVGGSFASFNGIPYRSIAQLNEDGSVDTNFNTAGADGTVYSIAVYSTNDTVNGGKILIGGDFTSVNNTNVGHIARLNADGSLDTTFNSALFGAGPNDSVRTIAIQVDGKVLIGGLFTSVDGVLLNYIARLDSFGEVDTNFNVGQGADDPVTAIALQQDLNIVVGGAFTHANGVTRNRLTRLNSDGTVDASINFGQGANSVVDAVVIQPDTKLVIGGAFTQFDGESKPYIARLYGGSQTGSGAVQFSTANFQVNESQGVTNVTVSVIRLGGTGFNGPGGYNGPINVVLATSDGNAIAGTDYTGVTTNLTFNVGETLQTVTIPILIDPTNMGQLFFNLTLTDPVDGDPASFAQLGNQSTAIVTIIGANSTVSFNSASYSVNKNITGGQAFINITRNDSTIGPASIDFETTTNGTATPDVDYVPVTNTVFFAAGQSNATAAVSILNNAIPEGNTTVGLALLNPTNTALDPTLPTVATLTIVDNSIAPGHPEFAASGYTNLETDSNAVITVLRVGGSVNSITVNYSTSDNTAVAGSNYVATSGSLVFLDGQTSNSFLVPLKDNTNQTSDLIVNLTLSAPPGGPSVVGPTTVPLTILNANEDVSFAQAGYFVDEKAGSKTISVNRFGGVNATNFVNYTTVNGTATAGVNYGFTSNTLEFLPGQTSQSFTIPIIDDTNITGNLVFFVTLSPSTNGTPVRLVDPSTTTVTVLDDDSGFQLSSPAYTVVKSNTVAIIPVLRLGSTAGSESVSFAATGGSAESGVEYVPTNGVLTFVSGQASNSFAVTIMNDNQIDGNQTVDLALSNPTGGAQLLSPSSAVLTIVDTESGFSFTSTDYSVNENGVAANITVKRTGVTSTSASVNFGTSDGTAHAPGQYITTNGTLNFTNGQTQATFNVPIIDNNVTGGSETVELLLSSPSADALLISPVAATLTILNNDGSHIIPAGAALIGISNGVVVSLTNGVINPNSTSNRVLLSLLNVPVNGGGSDATNVTATLIATNGITPIGSPVQNYGTLLINGPSVFRPFIFNATNSSDTNGAPISAVLQLVFGSAESTNITTNTVSYSFELGTVTNVFTNPGVITINDLAPATPYPSSITITSLVGVISKVTASVSNLNHGSIADVQMLLAGPASQTELLMERDGGFNHVANNLDLTFDSTASAIFTTNMPTSGTYRPSPLSTANAFPTNITATSTNGPPAPPASGYSTNLGDFIGTNPNGNWSLYVADTFFLNSGSINNGWSLSISTLNVVTPNVDLVVGLSAAPSPVVVSNTLVYTIAVTNAGPSPASGVVVADTLPPGVAILSAAATNFTVTGSNLTVSGSSSVPASALTTNSGIVTCTFTNLDTNSFGILTISVVPTTADLGFITNAVSVTSSQIEDNPADNTASVVTAVNTPTADLAIGVTPPSNPVFVNNTVVYLINVTNLGPALATNIIVTNSPAGIVLGANTAAGGAVTNAGTVTFNLGSLASGLVTNFTITAQANIAGTFINSFGVSSPVPDPLKGDNFASVKTIVEFVPLSVTHSGNSLTFTWPSTGNVNYILQFATNLNPPVAWQTVSNGTTPFFNGGAETVTVPVGSAPVFFRLISH